MNDRPSDGQVRPPAPGLCARCAHVQLVPSARGATFYLCRRSFTDPAFPRYPPLPVIVCPGFEAGDAETDDRLR
jgi:hypothetical protein